MLRLMSVGVLLFGIPSMDAMAALIQVKGSDPSQPFSASYVAGSHSPLSLILQIQNDTDTTLNARIWQLDLELAGLAGATDGLSFQAAQSLPDGLFDPLPGPISSLVGPNTRILVFDGDLVSLEGQPIPSNSARSIVELQLVVEPGTSGVFELRMRDVDPFFPPTGSSLLEYGELLPKGFGNPPPPIGRTILLGTIAIVSVPEPSAWSFGLSIVIAGMFNRQIGTPPTTVSRQWAAIREFLVSLWLLIAGQSSSKMN